MSVLRKRRQRRQAKQALSNMKYRVVEYKPDTFAIQIRGWFGWRYHSTDYGMCEYESADCAEQVIRMWLAEEKHEPRIVREF